MTLIVPARDVRWGRGDLAVEVCWHDADLDMGALVTAHPAPVHVVLGVPDVGGDRDGDVVAPWLSEVERIRRERILHPRAKAEFLAGRRLIRSLVGQLIGVSPREVRLVENEYGALALDPAAHGDTGWRFNLSHTDGLIALALARTTVGIDVEHTTRVGRTVELADRFFAKAEVTALRALPEARWRDRFFDLWTLKEAYIKARGMGLAIPLGDFAFTLERDTISIAVAPERRDVPDESWRFRLADIGAAHRLAVALTPA